MGKTLSVFPGDFLLEHSIPLIVFRAMPRPTFIWAALGSFFPKALFKGSAARFACHERIMGKQAVIYKEKQ